MEGVTVKLTDVSVAAPAVNVTSGSGAGFSGSSLQEVRPHAKKAAAKTDKQKRTLFFIL